MNGIPEGWTQVQRETGLIEWVCPHNVGHPAPAAYQIYREFREYGGHGCDGCCKIYNPKPERKNEIPSRTANVQKRKNKDRQRPGRKAKGKTKSR